MNQKNNEESIPKIIDIEEQEIEEKKPPNNNIINFKIVNGKEKLDFSE